MENVQENKEMNKRIHSKDPGTFRQLSFLARKMNAVFNHPKVEKRG